MGGFGDKDFKSVVANLLSFHWWIYFIMDLKLLTLILNELLWSILEATLYEVI